MKKRLRRAVLLLPLLLLGLIAGVSYAWLSQNTELFSDNHEIQLKSYGVAITSYLAYQYNSDANRIDCAQTDDGKFTMTPFDSIFTERNENTPLIIVLNLRGISSEQDKLTITAKCEEGHDVLALAQQDATDNFTSNIIGLKACFSGKCGIDPLSDEDNENAEKRRAFYSSVLAWARNDANAGNCPSAGFVTVGGNTPAKTTEAAMELNLDGHSESETAYLIIDYDKSLIELQNIVSFGEIDISQRAAAEVDFANDIISIDIS